jgi:FMN phosphatase YigB (HAD superfamily)
VNGNSNCNTNFSEKGIIMTAQAFIFDLSAFPGTQAERLLSDAVEHGLPCALISDLPYPQAEQQLRRRFGDTAHHLFSVVLTGADFKVRGHRAPYAVVLDQLGVPPDEALAVTGSARAIAAAERAHIGVQAGPTLRH